jgi:hypothetical protein
MRPTGLFDPVGHIWWNLGSETHIGALDLYHTDHTCIDQLHVLVSGGQIQCQQDGAKLQKSNCLAVTGAM